MRLFQAVFFMYYTLTAGKNRDEDRMTNYQRNGLLRARTRHLMASMARLIKWLLASQNEVLALLNTAPLM